MSAVSAVMFDFAVDEGSFGCISSDDRFAALTATFPALRWLPHRNDAQVQASIVRLFAAYVEEWHRVPCRQVARYVVGLTTPSGTEGDV